MRADDEPSTDDWQNDLPPFRDDAENDGGVPPFAKFPRTKRRSYASLMLEIAGAVLVIGAVVGAVFAITQLDPGTSSVDDDPLNPMVIAPGNDISLTVDDATSPAPSATEVIVAEKRYKGLVVCLDPGHGGDDRGIQRPATANAPALDEAYMTLAIAEDLASRLRQRGITVVLTRDGDSPANADGFDTNLDGEVSGPGGGAPKPDPDELQARIDACNDAGADLFVSIHADSSSDPATRGFTTWFNDAREFSPMSQLLASQVNEELSIELRKTGYQGGSGGVRSKSPDSARPMSHISAQAWMLGPQDVGMKEPSAMPGVIVEVLTISNDDDILYLMTEKGKHAIIDALDQAVVRYFDFALSGE